MQSFKEIPKNAACAWYPAGVTSTPSSPSHPSHQGNNNKMIPIRDNLIAAGTLSGVMDESFNSDAFLEIYDLNTESGDRDTRLCVSVSAPARYLTQKIQRFQNCPSVAVNFIDFAA